MVVEITEQDEDVDVDSPLFVIAQKIHEVEISEQDSLMRNMLQFALFSSCYVRGLFPEKYSIPPLGVYHELQNKYLKTLLLCVADDAIIEEYAYTHVPVEDEQQLLWCHLDTFELSDVLSNFPDISVETVYKFTLVKEKIDGQIPQVFDRALQVEDLLCMKGTYVEGMEEEVHLSTGHELIAGAGGEGTDKKVLQVVVALLFSSASHSPTTLVSNMRVKHKSSSDKLRVKKTQKFKRESRGEQHRHVPRKAALLIGMTYENQENPQLLLEASAEECHAMKKILRKYYDFSKENILTMSEKEKNKLHIPTKDNIRWEVRKLIKNAVEGDSLFLYVSGHGENVNGEAAITSADDKPLLESYWSGLGEKIRKGVTLTAVMNTCFGGKFFENANVEGKGTIIAYSPGGPNSLIPQGHFFYRVLAPIMEEGRGKSNLQIYRKIRRALKRIDRHADPRFRCPEEVLINPFLLVG